MFNFPLVIISLLLTQCNLEENNQRKIEINNNDSEIGKIKFLNFNRNLVEKEMFAKRMLQEFVCKNNESDCSGNGVCNEAGNGCNCNAGYTTLTNKKTKITAQCNYLMKYQLKAFLLELFVGFGAGHFYSLRYLHASLKLVAFLFGIYLICLFPLTAKCISDKFDSDFFVFFVSCFYYLCVIGLAFWFVWDLVMFGLNRYKDGNGLSLLKWGNPTS